MDVADGVGLDVAVDAGNEGRFIGSVGWATDGSAEYVHLLEQGR